MLGAEEATEASSAPIEARPHLVALVIMETSFALAGVLPWERFCRGLSGTRCFHAAIWSGSGPVFGLLAEVLALMFLALAVLRRWWTKEVTPAAVTLVASTLAAVAIKAVFVFGNAAINQRNQSPPSPAAYGVVVGVVFGVAGIVALIAAFTRFQRPVGPLIASSAAIVLLIFLSIPYGWSGFGWWGGPLASPGNLGGGNGAGFVTRPGHPVLLQSLLYLHNESPVSVTLDGLDAVGNPGYRILGTYVVSNVPCGTGAIRIPGLVKGECAYRLAGWRVRASSNGLGQLALLVVPPSPGVYRLPWLRIRYHVGPVHFEVFRTDSFEVCVPAPGEERCQGF